MSNNNNNNNNNTTEQEKPMSTDHLDYVSICQYIWDDYVWPSDRVAHQAAQAEDQMVHALKELKQYVDKCLEMYQDGKGWDMLSTKLVGSFGPNDRLSPIASKVAMNAQVLYSMATTVVAKSKAQVSK